MSARALCGTSYRSALILRTSSRLTISSLRPHKAPTSNLRVPSPKFGRWGTKFLTCASPERFSGLQAEVDAMGIAPLSPCGRGEGGEGFSNIKENDSLPAIPLSLQDQAMISGGFESRAPLDDRPPACLGFDMAAGKREAAELVVSAPGDLRAPDQLIEPVHQQRRHVARGQGKPLPGTGGAARQAALPAQDAGCLHEYLLRGIRPERKLPFADMVFRARDRSHVTSSS